MSLQNISAAEWRALWGASGGEFNCSTGTFDVGCPDCAGATDVWVAAEMVRKNQNC